MSVIGVGTDLVEIQRVARILARHPERFVRRVLTEREQAGWRVRRNASAWLAKRYAGKEALAKALGTGIGARVGFHDLEILPDAAGAPRVTLHGKAARHARYLGADHAHLSLSDEGAYALAFAVLEGPQRPALKVRR